MLMFKVCKHNEFSKANEQCAIWVIITKIQDFVLFMAILNYSIFIYFFEVTFEVFRFVMW